LNFENHFLFIHLKREKKKIEAKEKEEKEIWSPSSDFYEEELYLLI